MFRDHWTQSSDFLRKQGLQRICSWFSYRILKWWIWNSNFISWDLNPKSKNMKSGARHLEFLQPMLLLGVSKSGGASHRQHGQLQIGTTSTSKPKKVIKSIKQWGSNVVCRLLGSPPAPTESSPSLAWLLKWMYFYPQPGLQDWRGHEERVKGGCVCVCVCVCKTERQVG